MYYTYILENGDIKVFETKSENKKFFTQLKKEYEKSKKNINKYIKHFNFKTEKEVELFKNSNGELNKDEITKKIKEINKANSQKAKLEKEKQLKERELKIFLPVDAIYSDASGAGNKILSRVTRFNKTSLIKDYLKKDKDFNNHLKDIDNSLFSYYQDDIEINFDSEKLNKINYAESFALYCAIIIAMKVKCKIIYADCDVATEQWSKFKGTPVERIDIELIYRLSELRERFEKQGGQVKKISGDINPADFGNKKHKTKGQIEFVYQKDENVLSIDEYNNLK